MPNQVMAGQNNKSSDWELYLNVCSLNFHLTDGIQPLTFSLVKREGVE